MGNLLLKFLGVYFFMLFFFPLASVVFPIKDCGVSLTLDSDSALSVDSESAIRLPHWPNYIV